MVSGAVSRSSCADDARVPSGHIGLYRDGSSRLVTGRSLRTGMLARLFIRNLEPPYRIRIKVLPQLTPKHEDFDFAWSAFVDSQL